MVENIDNGKPTVQQTSEKPTRPQWYQDWLNQERIEADSCDPKFKNGMPGEDIPWRVRVETRARETLLDGLSESGSRR